MDTASSLAVDDIWTPAKPLPRGAVLSAIAARCGHLWRMPDLARSVRIVYNPRLRSTAGRALLKDGVVELNVRLLRDHPDQLVPTLAHELAHIAVYRRRSGDRPHGRRFAELMTALGLSPEATHHLPVAHLTHRRRRYLYLHRCSGCGRSFITRNVRRGYYCTVCGPDMSWRIVRAPNTQKGRKALHQMMLECSAES